MANNNNKSMPSKAKHSLPLHNGEGQGVRVYIRPSIQVIELDTSNIMVGSDTQSGDAGIGGGGAGNGRVRAPRRDWQDWEQN